MTSSRQLTYRCALLWSMMCAMDLVRSGSEVKETNSSDDDEDFTNLLVAACLDHPVTSPMAGESESRYYGQPTLDLRCPSRHMVRIVDLLYGHAEPPAALRTTHVNGGRFPFSPPRCHYASGDCVTHLPSTDLDVPCVGNSVCPITVPMGDHGRPIPGCNRTTTYVQATYQCIPEFAVIDVCSARHATSAVSSRKLIGRQRGFIRTPGYPLSPYPNGVDCELTIEAPHTFQKVRLDAVDVQLETNGTGCADWLETFDGLQSTTLCGRRARRRLGTSSHRTYRIRFISNDRVQHKGFLLYFEAAPFVRVAETPSKAATSSSTTLKTGDISKPPDASDVLINNWHVNNTSTVTSHRPVILIVDRSKSFPLVAETLVGVIGGLFACILIVCIVTVIVTKRRHPCPRHPSPDVAPCYVVQLPSVTNYIDECDRCDGRLLPRFSSTSTDAAPDPLDVSIDARGRASAAATSAVVNMSVSTPSSNIHVATPKSNAEKSRLRQIFQQQQPVINGLYTRSAGEDDCRTAE